MSSQERAVVVFDFELDLQAASRIGIRNRYRRRIRGGPGNDIIEGFAYNIVDAFATTFPTTFPDPLAADVTGISIAAADSIAIGINNARVLNTGNGDDVIKGVAVAEADAFAEANVAVFSLGVTRLKATSVALASATAIGVRNNNRSLIRTGKGGDRLIGHAMADGNATAAGIAIADAIADLSPTALADANIRTIARVTSVTATGIHNFKGIITMGIGADLIRATAFTTGQAVADATSIAFALAQLTAIANASATATSEITLIRSEAINNTQGKIFTGLGADRIFALACYSPESVASAIADATATFAENTDSEATTDSVASIVDTIAIGINNKDGKIDTARGKDSITGYGTTAGIVGGEIHTGAEDDLIRTAIIDDFNPFTRQFTISQDQTNAIADARVYLGTGNDIADLGGFGGEVRVDGGAGSDTLKLQGEISDYDITVVSARRQILTFAQSGNLLTVKGFEHFTLGNTDFTFAELAG
jgi:hypothetical protein